jgi:hypothetical protein
VDYYGTPRPVGGGYDIGAVEYRGQAWLGGDNPPVPSGGGTKPSSGAPVQVPDAPVAMPPGGKYSNDPVRLGGATERWRYLEGESKRSWGAGLNRVTVAPRPATINGAITSVPQRAGDAPATASANTRQATSRSYLLVFIGWFKDTYRKLALL